jgi:hypothetical protein
VDLTDAGWRLQRGQAIWRSGRAATEIAGEVVLCTHPDGRALLQFFTGPVPLVAAQTTRDGWQIEFMARRRVVTGRGRPPARPLWLHLAPALAGAALSAPLRCERPPDGSWRLENPQTGETLSGILHP